MDQQVKVVGFLFGVVATVMLFFGGYRLLNHCCIQDDTNL